MIHWLMVANAQCWFKKQILILSLKMLIVLWWRSASLVHSVLRVSPVTRIWCSTLPLLTKISWTRYQGTRLRSTRRDTWTTWGRWSVSVLCVTLSSPSWLTSPSTVSSSMVWGGWRVEDTSTATIVQVLSFWISLTSLCIRDEIITTLRTRVSTVQTVASHSRSGQFSSNMFPITLTPNHSSALPVWRHSTGKQAWELTRKIANILETYKWTRRIIRQLNPSL